MKRLLNFIKMDLRAYKSTFAFSTLYALIFPICFKGIYGTIAGGYITTIVMVSYLLFISLLGFDENYKSRQFYAMLPIKNGFEVLCRFLEQDLYFVLITLLFFAAGGIAAFLRFDYTEFIPKIGYVAIGFLATSILDLLMLPPCFKFGLQKGRIISMIVIVVLFIVVGAANSIVISQSTSLNISFSPIIVIGTFALAVIIQAAAYIISKRIYTAKGVE